MALVNQAKREINVKIVYVGPGLAGKTTNLKYVHGKLKREFRGALKSMQVQGARMLFFDFTPPGDSSVDGYRVRFHVYTLSGGDVDASAWKMVLKGVDGIVYVADAAADRVQANRDGLDNLTLLLKGYGQSLSSLPVVLQYNKRDLPSALSQEELEMFLNPGHLPSFSASSQQGEGVLQTLLHLVKSILAALRKSGVESVTAGEALQGMVEPRPVSAEAAPEKGGEGAAVTAAPAVAEAEAAPKVAIPADSFQEVAETFPEQAEPAPEAAAHAPAEDEEPLSVELAGGAVLAEPGRVRLPLTVRCGAKTRSVSLDLTISLSEI